MLKAFTPPTNAQKKQQRSMEESLKTRAFNLLFGHWAKVGCFNFNSNGVCETHAIEPNAKVSCC